jgi:DUF2075 family protein
LQLGGQRVRAFLFFPHEIVAQFDHGRNVSFGDFCITLLVASSGARRLRADGFGVMLNASAGAEIANWYLNAPGDIRSSYALEVPANEYTSQGLELDFVCVCWGGDMIWSTSENRWVQYRLSGTKWQLVRDRLAQTFIQNSYRVLLTRAREGMVIWIPPGDNEDETRKPADMEMTERFLLHCGARELR